MYMIYSVIVEISLLF